VGALLIGRIVLVAVASIAAGTTSANAQGPVSVDSEVATGLVRQASHDQEVKCSPQSSPWPYSAWRFTCELPREWAEVDVRITADGRSFVILPGSVRDMPDARHRSQRFVGTWEVSKAVCAPLGDRHFLCDARFDGSTEVEVELRQSRYGNFDEHCRLAGSQRRLASLSIFACQMINWDINMPTSTVKGMAEMARQVRRKGL
jgi:hypothetical protein